MTNHTETVECPKCLGTKTFRTWSHIANGVCFFCYGAGVVDMAKAESLNPSKMGTGFADVPKAVYAVVKPYGAAYAVKATVTTWAGALDARAEIGGVIAKFTAQGGLVLRDGTAINCVG